MYRTFILLFLLALQGLAWGGELGIDDTKEAMKRAEGQIEPLLVPKNGHQTGGGQKAQEIADILHSKEYQEKLKAETERVKNELFPQYLPTEQKPPRTAAAKQAKTAVPALMAEERIYLFISSSMPAAALRNYARDLSRIGNSGSVYMVLRGFVGGFGDFKATRAFARGFLDKEHPVNLIIDPLAFRKYGINRVPVAVYARGVNPMEGIECVAGRENGGEFWEATGDAPLRELLEHINQDAHSETLGRFLAEDL